MCKIICWTCIFYQWFLIAIYHKSNIVCRSTVFSNWVTFVGWGCWFIRYGIDLIWQLAYTSSLCVLDRRKVVTIMSKLETKTDENGGTGLHLQPVSHVTSPTQHTLWIYIYKAEILSVCLSVILLTRLELLTSLYQLPNNKNPSSSSFKFVTMSKCGDQLALYSRLKMKKWRKLEQRSIKNHSHMAQSVVQLTSIQETVGSNPGGEQIFLILNINTFANTFFRI